MMKKSVKILLIPAGNIIISALLLLLRNMPGWTSWTY